MLVLLCVLFAAAASLFAQGAPPCAGTPAWSSCDLPFELAPNENPDNVELRGEFRSPHHRTYVLRAFRDGDKRYIIRFTPTESGDWEYRLSSNLSRLEGQAGQITAGSSESPGFVHAA